MVDYCCKKCGKKFNKKLQYDEHLKNKISCVHNINSDSDSDSDLNSDSDSECESETKSKSVIEKEKSVANVRKEGLDKFYTNIDYSKKCIDKVFELYDINKFDSIIEPSAGNGSFLNQINSKNKIGIDIAPENENIIKQDFLNYKPPENKKNILVIGNPPFGKVSSIAIKFFNHSAQWANIIAFIIPRTFRRNSVQNKLNKKFHLVYDEDTPTNPCSFSPKMMVKCCFQIWEKQKKERDIIKLPTIHNDWNFLSFGPKDDNNQPTPPNGADFAIRAYGGKIGEIVDTNLKDLRPKSWHWIKSNIDKKILINRLKKLDYSSSLNTARQNSMGRGDLIKLYSDFVNSIV
jgi:hypothetical protein